MNILKIDTSDNKKTTVSLNVDSRINEQTTRRKKGAQSVLNLISKLLLSEKMSIFDISEVRVERGPGSFTGLRVGVAIANALAFSIQKKINNKDLSELETPVY